MHSEGATEVRPTSLGRGSALRPTIIASSTHGAICKAWQYMRKYRAFASNMSGRWWSPIAIFATYF